MKLSKDEDVGAPFVSHGVCYHLIGSYRGQVPSVKLYVGSADTCKVYYNIDLDDLETTDSSPYTYFYFDPAKDSKKNRY